LSDFLAPPPDGPVEPGPVPSFSILICAYQAAELVGEAVESALTQTVPAHEVIVCDDGSTDDIEAALRPYQDRIKLIRQEHQGIGAARRTSVDAASGDFVVNLDADDLYQPERVEALGELAAARPDLDILTTDDQIEVDGKVLRNYYHGSLRFRVTNQRRAILEYNFLHMPAVRRVRMLEIGSYDASFPPVEDWDCWIRLILAGCRAGLVERPLYRYRLQESGLSSDRAKLVRMEYEVLRRVPSIADLSADERSALEHDLVWRRRDALLQEARSAVLKGSPDARRRSLGIATGRGFDLLSRIKALATVVAPPVSRRVLVARERRRWVGAGGVEIPRDQ